MNYLGRLEPSVRFGSNDSGTPSWAPWKLVERGQEWILTPKSELVEFFSGVRKLPLREAESLSDEHKAVLLVVIGHRRRGGVSKTRVGEILGLDCAPYVKELRRLELIYADPAREVDFWRPTPEALLALGFRSYTEIPPLKELEEWFDAQKPKPTKLEPFFQKTEKLAARRQRREKERRETVLSVDLREIPGRGSFNDVNITPVTTTSHPR
jgi:chromosome segregation and condensation protein ScpB